jgi:hypothetical protein
METRKEEAVRAMGAASRYFHELEAFASELAGKKVNIGKVLDRLFPASSAMSSRQVKANREVKKLIKTLFKRKDDLRNFIL